MPEPLSQALAGLSPAERCRWLDAVAHLTRHSPVVHFLWRVAPGWPVEYVSESVSRFGYAPDDFVSGRVSWPGITHPDDVPRLEAETQRYIDEGRDDFHQRYRLHGGDGRVRWVDDHTHAIRGADGEITHFQGVLIDITEQEAAVAAERISAAQFRSAFDLGMLGLAVVDFQWRLLMANTRMAQMLGYDSAEAPDFNILERAMDPQDRERASAAYARMARGELQEYRAERRLKRRDGTTIDVNIWVRVIPFRHAGGDRAALVAVDDVTDERNVERRLLEIGGEERFRIGRDLHDSVGQELTAASFMTAALEQRLRLTSSGDVAKANEIGGILQRAIAQVRALARGLSPVPLGNGGLAAALGGLAANTTEVFGLSCTFDGKPAAPCTLDPDRASHLYHIAQEAVRNAVRHAHASRIVITLRQWTGGGELTVTDNGEGLPAATRPGDGMGLRIMRYRAVQARGELEIAPADGGRGTRVRCVFGCAAPPRTARTLRPREHS